MEALMTFKESSKWKSKEFFLYYLILAIFLYKAIRIGIEISNSSTNELYSNYLSLGYMFGNRKIVRWGGDGGWA